MIKSLGGGTRLVYTDGHFEHFLSTHWARVSDFEIQRLILDILEADEACSPTSELINAVLRLLKAKVAVSFELQHPDVLKPLINCTNGELWILPAGTLILRPHNPASRQHYCLDIVYDPTANCPFYDQAIGKIFSYSSDPKAMGDCWDEHVAIIIYPIRQEPRILVCRGSGGDGKSLLVRLAKQLLHSSVIAGMPVEELTGSRFVRGDLMSKRLFVDGDMTAGVKLPDGMLKSMSEGELVMAERKNRDSVTFTLKALPLLVGNNVPRLDDRSQGFKRRLCVMPFERSFTPEEQDPSLFQRIVEAEMSGVLNRALAGLQRLIQRGWKLDLPEDVKAATEAWWAEATGYGQALPPTELRDSRVSRAASQDGADASSPGVALLLPPEGLAASRQGAAATAVKVKVDLASSGTQQTVEVEATHLSVTVRVGPRV